MEEDDQNYGFDHDLVDTPLHSHALIKFLAIFKVRTISMPMGGIEAIPGSRRDENGHRAYRGSRFRRTIGISSRGMPCEGREPF